jgi:hypothetical protein
VSDLAVSWVAVAPSAWRRRLRCGAIAAVGAVTVATVAVRLTGSGTLAAVVAAGFALLLVGVFARIDSFARDDRAWSLTADGRIVVRGDDATCRDAAIVYVSPFLIVLRAGWRSLEIWRDATPIPAFRRLSVAARWHVPRDSGAAG